MFFCGIPKARKTWKMLFTPSDYDDGKGDWPLKMNNLFEEH
jgi:hypothetical protein